MPPPRFLRSTRPMGTMGDHMTTNRPMTEAIPSGLPVQSIVNFINQLRIQHTWRMSRSLPTGPPGSSEIRSKYPRMHLSFTNDDEQLKWGFMGLCNELEKNSPFGLEKVVEVDRMQTKRRVLLTLWEEAQKAAGDKWCNQRPVQLNHPLWKKQLTSTPIFK